jgi:cytochrome P450
MEIPGPTGWQKWSEQWNPFLLFQRIRRLQHDPIALFQVLTNTYGPVSRHALGPLHFVLINDPTWVSEILFRTKKYDKGWIHQRMRSLLGNGIAVSQGSFWKKQRVLLQPAFSPRFFSTYSKQMHLSMIEAIQRLHGMKHKPIDIHHELSLLSLDIACRCFLGGSLEPALKEEILSSYLLLNQKNFENLSQMVPLPNWIPTKKNREHNKALHSLNEIVFKLIEQKWNDPNLEGDEMISLLLQPLKTKPVQISRTKKQIRDEILTMLLASHETTAAWLAWVFFYLSLDPAIAIKIREELASSHTSTFTQAFFQEVLRLHPPAWNFARVALENDEVFGYKIYKNDVIVFLPALLHRNPKYWDRPNEFLPKRFEPHNKDQAPMPEGLFIPFGYGPRHCIGKEFAFLQGATIVKTFLQEFDFTLAHGVSTPKDFAGLTLSPRAGIHLLLKPRKFESTLQPPYQSTDRKHIDFGCNIERL